MSLTTKMPSSAGDFFALPPSDYVDARSLAANTAETLTIPDGATFVMFSATGDFYAAYDATATVPGDVSDGTASELNPSLRKVLGKKAISVIAPANTVVTAAYYKAP